MIVIPRNYRCGLCGAVSSHRSARINVLFGVEDLDQRSRDHHAPLQASVQRCPTCGLCARRIDNVRDEFARAAMASREYAALCARTDLPRLAQTYLLASCVERARGFAGRAAWFALSAGWVCDDAGNELGAADARSIAVVRVREARRRRLHVVPALFTPSRGTSQLVLVDTLRKLGDWSGAFGAHLELLRLGRRDPTWIVNAVAFEEHLIRERDAANYRQRDADDWCNAKLFASLPPTRTLKSAGWSLGQKPEDREPSAPALEVKPPSGVVPLFFWRQGYEWGRNRSIEARWGRSPGSLRHIDAETVTCRLADAINAMFPAMHQSWKCDQFGLRVEADYRLAPKRIPPPPPRTLQFEQSPIGLDWQRRIRRRAESRARRIAFAQAALRKRVESAA